MAALSGMTDDQIKQGIDDMKMQIRNEKSDFTRAKKQADDL